MKATLEFDLPEETDEHLIAVHAMDFALVTLDIAEELRKWLKYGHRFSSADDALEAAREKLYECLESRGVSTDMIR